VAAVSSADGLNIANLSEYRDKTGA